MDCGPCNESVKWIQGSSTNIGQLRSFEIFHHAYCTVSDVAEAKELGPHSRCCGTYHRRRFLLGARREELDHKRAYALLDQIAELGPLQRGTHGLSTHARRKTNWAHARRKTNWAGLLEYRPICHIDAHCPQLRIDQSYP